MTPLTGKQLKNPKKLAIFDHIFLKGHDANFEDFTILFKENNRFELDLKESLLIKRDKPELNRDIYSLPLELYDWLLSQSVFYYLHIYWYELIIHVIFMIFSWLLLAVVCYLRMLSMRGDKNVFIEKLFLNLIIYVDTNSSLVSLVPLNNLFLMEGLVNLSFSSSILQFIMLILWCFGQYLLIISNCIVQLATFDYL